MGRKDRTLDASQCIHCGKCAQNCTLLRAYKLNIGDADRLSELAYHCFLCGKCTEVCPKGIDGREIILNMRREAVKNGGKRPSGKGYGMLLLEKKNYLFRNYRNAAAGSVLFPGCNFPSFYPQTTKKLAGLLREKADIGVIYDCCGKPVAELGMEEEEKRIVDGLSARLAKNHVSEIITMCPNCYHFLKPRLSVRVLNVYEKLAELGIGEPVREAGEVFPPCPDREGGEIWESIRPFMAAECPVITDVECCGLGGSASAAEPEIARNFGETLAKRKIPRIYTYCASCSGNLSRSGCGNVRHVLAEILGTNEAPDIGRSLVNRAMSKFW